MPRRNRDYGKIAEKQIRKAQGAVQDYTDGIMEVTEAPGQAAVRKKDKLVNNFMASVNSGKWAENTAAVSLPEWQARAGGKGAERYSGGIEDARDKITAFHMDFGPKRDALADQVNNMPDATPEQRLAKMTANAVGMSKLRYNKKRR